MTKHQKAGIKAVITFTSIVLGLAVFALILSALPGLMQIGLAGAILLSFLLFALVDTYRDAKRSSELDERQSALKDSSEEDAA